MSRSRHSHKNHRGQTAYSPRQARPKGPKTLVVPVSVALVCKAYLTRLLVVGDPNPLRTLLLEAPLLITMTAAAHLLTRKRPVLSASALLTLNAVMSFVMLATTVYAAYFGQVVTAAALGLAGQAGEVQSSIVDLLAPAHLLYVVDLPLLIAWGFTRRAPRTPEPQTPGSHRGWRPALVAVLGLSVSAALIAAAWGLPDDVNSLAASRKYGVLTYQLVGLRTLSDKPVAATSENPAYDESVAAKIDRLRGKRGSDRLATFSAGQYAGKNVIVIQAEAVQDFLIGLEVDGVQVAPNLTALSKESWYFPRTYSQIARGNTSDAEFIANSSLYAPPDQAASVRWAAKDVPSMPKLLKQQGYATVAFHANAAKFWNRGNLYAALGFDRLYDREDIGWEPKWKWGSSDEVVFERGLSVLLSLRQQKTPFYAQFVTMSSHHPYESPPMDVRPYTPPVRLSGTSIGDYLSSQSYADKAIGGLIADLKKTGLWEESIVVVYGDHFGVRRPDTHKDRAALESVLGKPYRDTDFLQVPLIVHVPGQTAGTVVDATVGQVDILPTLADPLGLDLSGFTHFGRNAFVAGGELLGMRGVVAAGSMLNGRILFQPGIGFDDGTAMDLRTGLKVKPTEKDRRDYEAEVALLRLALEYTDRLPVRDGASADLGDAIIPNISKVSTATPDSPKP